MDRWLGGYDFPRTSNVIPYSLYNNKNWEQLSLINTGLGTIEPDQH